MKVTWSWLHDSVELPPTPEALAHALAMRGFPVASIEKGTSLDPTILVGRVLEVGPHPNADRLRLCAVDIGSARLSIVCGASNVAAGMAVAVAQVGSKLPDGTKLRKSKIRGVESEGMICSERELGLSEESEGIWALPGEPPIGSPVQSLLGGGDAILDVEITSNRTDCMSARGLAREIASTQRVRVKPVPALHPTGKAAPPHVTIENPDDCRRYMARVVEEIRIGPSPAWLAQRLEATGFRSINNVVDVTNYVLRTYGQPIHAFDAAKVEGGEIIVRRARAGETLTLLDGREVKLHPGVLLIADRVKPLALAGIMGGLESGVTETTARVILESAEFSPELTREAARSLGLDTDASQRFAQGVDGPGVRTALDETARLLAETASGKVGEGASDLWPGKREAPPVRLRRARLTRLLGMEVDRATILDALATLEILPVGTWNTTQDEGLFAPPPYRKDLEIEEDLIEEVARVVGYDAIPARVAGLGATVGTEPETAERTPMAPLRTRVIEIACGLGFDEILSTALVGDIPPEVLGGAGGADLWEVQNPKSRELKHLRTSLLPGILAAAARNLNHGARGVRLAEAGTVFRASPGPLGREWIEVGLVLAGAPDPWTEPGATPDRYLELKGAAEALLGALGIDSRKSGPYHERCWSGGVGLSISSDGKELARLGQVAPQLAAATGLERPAWAAVLDLSAIVSVIPARRRFQSLPKYPAVKRDLAILVDRSVPQGEVEETIRRGGGRLLASVRLFDVFEGEQLGSGKKSLAYALEFRSQERTLLDRDVDQAVQELVRALGAAHGATLRGGVETTAAGRP
jgi:phenylalanyl-tRNA synthetase beta chain